MWDLARGYAALVEGRLGEASLLEVAPEMGEMELQARWFAGEFGRAFTSTTGQAVQVVQFGVWNHEAGPDFAGAAVSIAGAPPMSGCIELDRDARDWERHGHATNADYEGVVLHVFTRQPREAFFTRTAAHRNVPQVLLDLKRLAGEAPNPQPAAMAGRCMGPLAALPEEKVREVLLGAALHRLRRKASALARLGELHGPDEALFQGLAAALGYRNNKLPFTLLAQRLPLRLLRAAKTDAPALLFGVAGFLPAGDWAGLEPCARAHLRSLWERWWPCRAQYERLSIAGPLWRMSGQRPANHPQRRLAALAQIVRHWPKVRALRDGCEPGAVHAFFARLHEEFWGRHYTLASKASARPMALVGAARVCDMLANVFFPIAVAADPGHAAVFQKLSAPLACSRVEVAALRLFGGAPLGRTLLQNLAMQQGLLQVYEDFCQRDCSDCALCPFPRQLARW